MTTPFDSEIAELMEQYRRQRAELGEMQREIEAITATAVAGQNAVKVTVNARGEIQDLVFPSGAYRRMAPLELAAVIKQGVQAAQSEAAERMREVISQRQGADAYLGQDWTQILPEEPEIPRFGGFPGFPDGQR